MAYVHDVTFSNRDAEAIARLLANHSRANVFASDASDELADLMLDARFVPDEALPPDYAGLHSRVTYAEERGAPLRTVVLAMPEGADAAMGRISVLSPVGLALIGRRRGSLTEAALPNGRRLRLRVLDVARASPLKAASCDGLVVADLPWQGTVGRPIPSTTGHKERPMNALTSQQLVTLAGRIAERKRVLLDDIRRVLKRRGAERHADLVGDTSDAGDEAAASLLRDVTEAEVVRDVGEMRDIAAAEARIAAGGYGVCIDCRTAIDFKRLEAYPTAKRCLPCQQRRERTRAPSRYTGR